MVLTFGSFATEIHEPCQVRNEAALSENFCVPEGSQDRANCIGNVCGLLFEVRRAVFQFIIVMEYGLLVVVVLVYGTPVMV